MFAELTKDQVIRFKVSGKKVRMDSKLLHSNVAKTTRLQMSLGVVRKFYKSLSVSETERLKEEDQILAKAILEKSPSQYTYGLNKETATEQLEKVGQLVFAMHELYSDLQSSEYELLGRLWNEHFELETSEEDDSKAVSPKDMKNQGGTPLQSAHDPQATYRNKPGSKKQIITGYVSNITEACSKKEEGKAKRLDLITDVQTTPATTLSLIHI